ncbi:hypothetical protein GCM10023195_53700 [Actinoallomurus liliacearum]|uniref:Peptidase C14 caspase domain-containing protein n=1 Tax=Actinoallomurus liliacearum TaxID=1080073 RepID=A0ABP8TS26_9ACTN
MAGRNRALLIGNGFYPKDPITLPPLNGPPNDLSHLSGVLTHPAFGVFLPEDVTQLPERESHEILDALRALCAGTGNDDLLLIYYSGHGYREPGTDSLLLCARDTVAADAATAVSFAQISEILDDCPAGALVIILDCCYSGLAKAVPSGEEVRELAGRGRFILSATRTRGVARDADVVGGLSEFTDLIVDGLYGKAVPPNAPDAEEITVEDLYSYLARRMRAGKGTVPPRKFDGYGYPVLARFPDFVREKQPSPARTTTAPAPRAAKAIGRWSLTLLLGVLLVAGSGGFAVAVDELAYRAQWRLAEAVEKPVALGSLGPAFTEVAILVFGLATGLFVCAAFLSRALGAWWWIPPSLLTLWAASGAFDGLLSYGSNRAVVLVPAMIMLLSATRLRTPHRDPGKTRELVVGTALIALPCTYLAYRFGDYESNQWTATGFRTFAALKKGMAVDRTFWVTATEALGFALGALAVHWTIRWIPVLGRARDRRRVNRPWLRRTILWSVLLTLIPGAVTLGAFDYIGRLDYRFGDPGVRALVRPWLPYADRCDDTGECVLNYLGGTSREISLSVLRFRSGTDEAADIRQLYFDRPALQKGTVGGYTYFVSRYDGHDGVAVWTHSMCSCQLALSVHNNQDAYHFFLERFRDFTGIRISGI